MKAIQLIDAVRLRSSGRDWPLQTGQDLHEKGLFKHSFATEFLGRAMSSSLL
jgi:hypothetical protein